MVKAYVCRHRVGALLDGERQSTRRASGGIESGFGWKPDGIEGEWSGKGLNMSMLVNRVCVTRNGVGAALDAGWHGGEWVAGKG